MNKLRVFYYFGIVCLLWTAISMEHSNNKVVVIKLHEPVGTLDLDDLSKHSLAPDNDVKEEWDKDFKSAIIPIKYNHAH